MNLIIKGIRNPFYNIGLVNPIWEIRPAKSMSIEDSAACCLVKYSREIVITGNILWSGVSDLFW